MPKPTKALYALSEGQQAEQEERSQSREHDCRSKTRSQKACSNWGDPLVQVRRCGGENLATLAQGALAANTAPC